MNEENQEVNQTVKVDQTMSSDIGKLVDALAKAQGEMRPAIKDAANPFFKSKYADISSVWDSARGPLSKNGLAVIQTTEGSAEDVKVITLLAHSSGQWIRSSLTLKPVKADPQGVGSAITYGRRYLLSAIIGGSADDDDGNAASGKNGQEKPVAAKPETLNEAEQFIISNMLEEVGKSETEFCKSCKIASLAELPRAKFENAKAYLGGLSKKEKKEKAA